MSDSEGGRLSVKDTDRATAIEQHIELYKPAKLMNGWLDETERALYIVNAGRTRACVRAYIYQNINFGLS